MKLQLPRIIFVSPHIGRDRGGVGASAERIINYLRRDYEVITISPDRDLAAAEIVSSQQTGLTNITFGPQADSSDNCQFLSDLVISLIRKFEVQVICGFYLNELSYAATCAAHLCKVPTILCVRGNDIDLDIFGPRSFMIHYQLQRAWRVCCVSNEMCHKVSSFCADVVPVLLPNGVDPIEFPDLGPDEANHNAVVIGIFGEIKAKKGLPLLLKAINFEKFCLKIVGRLSDDSAKLLHGFLNLHPECQSRIQMLPYVKDTIELLRHYRETDLVCLPSLHDGLPNVLLEAMSCGRVVLASDVGGALDVISHRENGLLFSSGNLIELRRELDYFESLTPTKKREMALKARQTISQRFHWQNEYSAYRKLFSNCLSSDTTDTNDSRTETRSNDDREADG